MQAYGKIPYKISRDVDLYSISAHKIGGLKGVGALIKRKSLQLPPYIYGGGQEAGLRAGTEPVAQIVGFAKAVEHRVNNLDAILSHTGSIRNYALDRLAAIPDLEVIGRGDAPHILSVSLPGYPSQNIVSDLDSKGICISAGSACHRGKASHVLVAMGLEKKVAAGMVRISFGPETTFEDIDALYEALLTHKNTRFPML